MKNRYLLYAISFLQGMVFYGPVATLYRQARGFAGFLAERVMLSVVLAGMSGVDSSLLYQTCDDADSCPVFPWNTSSIPAEKRLAQEKNPSPLVILPVFRCGLVETPGKLCYNTRIPRTELEEGSALR